jgi:tetratricopeptide (TPR) repeat protein
MWYLKQQMKNFLLTITFLLISTFLFGQQMSYTSWKEEAKTNIRLLPKYGNVSKTKEQKQADEEMINSYLEKEGTPRKASELLIRLGYDYLYKGDIKTAMYRFNQAWLMDPKNDNVFWGFGAVYFMFQDYEAAMVQYDEGLKLNPKNSNILTDKATIYLSKYQSRNDNGDLSKATALFEESYSVDPKNQNTLFKASACYFMKGDCDKAWKYYSECKALGGEPITPEYTAALTRNCKK